MLDLRFQNLHRVYKQEKKAGLKVVYDDSELIKVSRLSKIQSNNLRKKYETLSA